MKTCYIIGALPFKNEIKPLDSDLLIAADKGLLYCREKGIAPDIVIGDFDSLDEHPTGENVIIHPERKDDTDTMLSLKHGLKLGFKRFYLYGCLGGRLDHTIANLQLLAFAAKSGATAFLCGEKECVTVIKDTIIKFRSGIRGKVSVFALNGKAEGVTEKGLSYSLQNAVLDGQFPLGVSNEFTEKSAEITVRNGYLTVIWNGTPDDSEVDI